MASAASKRFATTRSASPRNRSSRDDAIAAAARYGAALIAGRARCKSNNEFGDWIVAQGLDRQGNILVRQERQAAMQIAEIVAHVAKETVDSSSYCQPFSRAVRTRARPTS